MRLFSGPFAVIRIDAMKRVFLAGGASDNFLLASHFDRCRRAITRLRDDQQRNLFVGNGNGSGAKAFDVRLVLACSFDHDQLTESTISITALESLASMLFFVKLSFARIDFDETLSDFHKLLIII